MIKKFKIALVQMEIKPRKVEENLARAQSFIKKARSAGAEMIIFPEDFLTGPLAGEEKYLDREHKYRHIF